MNQLEINEIIQEIHEKLIILIENNELLKKYPAISQMYSIFDNPDSEWTLFYHLQDQVVLKDWLSVLSDIYYLMDYKDEKEIKPKIDMLESISNVLLNSLNKTKNLDDIPIKSEDKKYANFLTKYLKQYKNFTFLTSNVEEFKKKISGLESELATVSKKKELANLEEKKLLEIAASSEEIFLDLKLKRNFLNKVTDEVTNNEIKKLYNEIYCKEIALADKYRTWALIIFAVIGIILILGFLNLSIQNWNHLRDSSYIHIPFGWDSLLKTLMLFSLTTPAWYLTQESSKHRKVAYKAKMLGTELSSFPLYAREFKDEDRLELRKSLADRFFGQELYNGSSNSKNSNDVSIEQVKLIAEVNKVLAESLKVKQNLS